MATMHLTTHQAPVPASANRFGTAVDDRGGLRGQQASRRKVPELREVQPGASRLNNQAAARRALAVRPASRTTRPAFVELQQLKQADASSTAAGKENRGQAHAVRQPAKRSQELQTKPASIAPADTQAAAAASDATALVPAMPASSSAAKQNKQDATLLGSIPRAPYSAPAANAVKMVYIGGFAGRPINGATRIFPLGFSDPGENGSSSRATGYGMFLKAGGELARIVENDVVVPGKGMELMRVEDARVGVRGSSVTGFKSRRPGVAFDSQSDIDFFIESSTMTRDFKLNDYHMLHPDVAMANYPPVAEWSRKWKEELKRKVSVAIFPNHRLPDSPAIIVEKKT